MIYRLYCSERERVTAGERETVRWRIIRFHMSEIVRVLQNVSYENQLSHHINLTPGFKGNIHWILQHHCKFLRTSRSLHFDFTGDQLYIRTTLCVRCYTTSKSIRTEDVKLSIFQTLWIQKWTTILHLIANINTAISRQYWLHACLNKFTDLWMIFFSTETLCITRSAKSMLLKFTHSWPPWMRPISPYAQPMIYTAKTSWRPQLFLLASKLADLLTYSSRPIKPRQENRCK